ncbi:G/U mismatch-specific DNA glycosylase (plasmid) [Caulobacter sp. ErkDOM-YI]|uniref:G/U mismatch-specific DNA glycosylase n=1 Tax=unclassified Caulobacter TaxID=2648921 RepID=UPI003AF6E568
MTKPLPDIVGPDLNILVCGLNPGLTAAATGRHFAGRGNRFWKVLHLSGFTPRLLLPEQDQELLEYGIGLTCVVDRPTAEASEVQDDEFIRGAQGVERRVRELKPRYVAFLGKAAYAAILGSTAFDWGEQTRTFGGCKVWLLPNPSGRNRAFSTLQLVAAYSALLRACSGNNAPVFGPQLDGSGTVGSHALDGTEAGRQDGAGVTLISRCGQTGRHPGQGSISLEPSDRADPS